MKITSLEGFECGTADQHNCRSSAVFVYPLVTVNPLGSLHNRARNGHAARAGDNTLDRFLIRETV